MIQLTEDLLNKLEVPLVLPCDTTYPQIKLLNENKLIICAFVHLHYHISREKFEPELGLELGPPDL